MDRDAFFRPQELQTFEVEIEGLGKVRARELSNGDRIKQYDLWLAPTGETSKPRLQVAREKMITLCIVDDSGNLLLTEADIPKLRQMPARVVSQLVQIAMKCLGLSEDDLAEQLKKKPSDCVEINDGS